MNIDEIKNAWFDLAETKNSYQFGEDPIDMKNLFNSAEKFVIIYSSNKNKKHCKHVKHRKFSDWIKYNCPEWELLKYIPNKYPYNKNDEDNTSFADFYIFVNRSMSSVKK